MAAVDISDWCSAMLGGDLEELATDDEQYNVDDASPPVSFNPAADIGASEDDCCSEAVPAEPSSSAKTAEVKECKEEVPEVSEVGSAEVFDGIFKNIKAEVMQDDVFGTWVPHLARSLSPAALSRGPLQRPVVAASLFGGLSSDRFCYDLFGVANDWIFTLDKKSSCVSFGEKHFERAKWHFLEGLQLLQSTVARDLYSGDDIDLSKLKDMGIELAPSFYIAM